LDCFEDEAFAGQQSSFQHWQCVLAGRRSWYKILLNPTFPFRTSGNAYAFLTRAKPSRDFRITGQQTHSGMPPGPHSIKNYDFRWSWAHLRAAMLGANLSDQRAIPLLRGLAAAI
jgi:hypothetical protein